MQTFPELCDLVTQKHYRIIPSHYPTINFFEDLVDHSELEALWEIESLTNERIRQEVGDLFLVAVEDRVAGPGASVVMAAFTHIHFPSRFTDGSYGVYYAGLAYETAIRETVYWREKFLSYTQEPACEISMRVYQGTLVKPLYDIRQQREYEKYHHPESYVASQELGKTLREQNAWGILYDSVRHVSGNCVAIFRPPAISIPQEIAHLRYIWDGQRITTVYDAREILRFG